MSSRIKPFVWRNKPTQLELKTLKDQREIIEIPAYLIREGSEEKYMQLSALYEEFVISLDELCARVDLNNRYGDILSRDLENSTITCSFFHKDGTQVSDTEIRASRMHEHLTRITNSDSKQKLEWYRRQWVICFNSAIDIAEAQHPSAALKSLKQRFFVPSDSKEFRLYIIPGNFPDGSPVLGNTIEALTSHLMNHGLSRSVALVVYDVYETAALAEDMIKLSTNPLGLYSTWVDQKNISAIAEAQTNWGTWIRSQPEWRTASQLWTVPGIPISTPEKPEPLIVFPGDKIFHRTRMNMRDDSWGTWANTCAVRNFKWSRKANEDVAEWMLRVSPRIHPAASFNPRYAVFGTTECNTTLMRAEEAVHQLLLSGRVWGVSVNCKVRNDLEKVDMLGEAGPEAVQTKWLSGKPDDSPYPDCLTAALEYEIIYEMRTGTVNFQHHFEHTIYPFSRQRPFQFELELDKVMLEKYLDVRGPDPALAIAESEQERTETRNRLKSTASTLSGAPTPKNESKENGKV